MQALMMNSEEIEIIDPSTLIPVTCELEELSNRPSQPVPLVELGKQLFLSAKQGDVNNVRVLMGKGAPFTTDWLGTSPLHLAAQNNHVELAEILLRAGISKDSRTKVERTPLHVAAQEGHLELVRLMISYEADINSLDMLKMTPLHWAVERGHVEIIKLLLDNGSTVDGKNKFDKTVYDIAQDNDRIDIINLLNLALTKKEELNLENDTLTASTNLAIELGQVPVASKVEEVLTTPNKFKEKSIHPKKNVKTKQDPKISFISSNSDISNSPTLQLLQAHGITMLPADNSNIVTSAVESGQTVVLTEAGKLALQNIQLTQNSKSSSGATIRKTPIQQIVPKKKLITIKSGDIIMMSKTPNILKKETSRNITKVPKASVSAAEYHAIANKLMESQKQAEEYRLLLSKKEKEVEHFKQQLESYANLN